MSRCYYLAVAVLCIGTASVVHGHGTPILVSVNSEQLIVSGGLTGESGYVANMFVEDDEDGEPFAEVEIPPFGPLILWELPGFVINGMDNVSNLSLEVLIRPVADTLPLEQRTLWFWNPQTEMVAPAAEAAAIHLLARDDLSLTLLPTDIVAPPPLLLSDPLTGQQGFHNHGLLYYALDNEPTPPVGAYGFFARLLSDSYAPSDPFLVVLNRGITDYDKMPIAAQAINEAAKIAPLPGDYDASGQVDADDYAYWRARFGNTVASPFNSPDGNGNGIVDAADYVVWRKHSPASLGAARSLGAIIPEPNGIRIAAIAALLAASASRRRFRDLPTPHHRPFRARPCRASLS